MATVLNEKTRAGTTRAAGEQQHSVPSIVPLPRPDYSIFGDTIASAAQAYFTTTGLSRDFLFAGMLTVVASIVAPIRTLQVTETQKYRSILWTACVGKSGSGKTPVLEAAMRSVKEEYKRRREQYLFLKGMYEAELEQYERSRKAKKDGSKEISTNVPRPIEPTLNSTFTTETTIEGLARELSHNPGILMYVDELKGWLKSFNQYRAAGADRQVYINLWNGNTSNTLRSDAAKNVYIEHPVLCLLGGLQPSALADFTATADDGLPARILFVYPEHTMENRGIQSLHDPLAEVWEARCKALYDLDTLNLTLSDAAKNEYNRWIIEFQMRMSGEDSPLDFALQKMTNYVFRFAIVTQTLNDPTTDQIEEKAMIQATQLAEYFTWHLLKIYNHAPADELDAHAQKILAYALKKFDKGTTMIKARDIQRATLLPAQNLKVDYIYKVFFEMANRGYALNPKKDREQIEQRIDDQFHMYCLYGKDSSGSIVLLPRPITYLDIPDIPDNPTNAKKH